MVLAAVNSIPGDKVTTEIVEAALPFIEFLPHPVLWIDPEYRVRYVNAAGREVYGNDHGTCHRLTHGYEQPCHLQGENCPKIRADELGIPVSVLHSHATEQGNQIFMVLASPMENGDVIEFHIELTDTLCRDALTNLFTRAFFEQMVRRELSLLARMKLSYTLIFIDLDDFKQINDTNGHKAGDSALQAVGQTIMEILRDSDVAGRWGGEEFCIFLPGSNQDNAVQVAQRLCDAIRDIRLQAPFDHVKMTASLGVFSSIAKHYDFEEAVRVADLAMYRAKELGGNRIE
jgi:diguanylate cyclase (GGDEF)-like protein